jgi:hypothetical protein
MVIKFSFHAWRDLTLPGQPQTAAADIDTCESIATRVIVMDLVPTIEAGSFAFGQADRHHLPAPGRTGV